MVYSPDPHIWDWLMHSPVAVHFGNKEFSTELLQDSALALSPCYFIQDGSQCLLTACLGQCEIIKNASLLSTWDKYEGPSQLERSLLQIMVTYSSAHPAFFHFHPHRHNLWRNHRNTGTVRGQRFMTYWILLC